MAATQIYAVPTEDTAIASYELPMQSEAKVNFAPENIDGLKLDDNGGLVISFTDGGSVVFTNFQSFIDNGNTLLLSDGTKVDPSLLFNALGGTNDNPFPNASEMTKIGVPADNEKVNITLESGEKYLLDFDLTETQGANVKDGKMIIDFANGGQITIENYEVAMAGETPPELNLASKTCVVTGDELITNIQQLAKTTAATEEEVVAIDEEAAKRKSNIADADLQGQDDIGPGDQTKLGYKAPEEEVANIEPAAGDEAAALAAIEPAAGGAAGSRNSGYGFNSRPSIDPFNTNPDIGPINPTALGYQAPRLTPSEFIINDDPDSGPLAIAPGAKFVDETNLASGPVSVSGKVDVDFGADGPGGINPNGNFSSGGSKTGGNLTHNGEAVTVTIEGNNYVGRTQGGDKVFELTVNSTTGDYTFTQFLPLDHANGSDPNDQITLNFGIRARDGDGDSVNTTVQIVVADDAPTASGDTQTIDETDLGPITVSSSISVDYGQDGPGRVETTGTFNAGGSVKGGTLMSSGVPVTVTSTATGYEGKAGGVTVFTLVINKDTGEYTYTQFKNLDHADNSNPDDIITLTFGTNVIDFDGDKAPAPIIINIKDDAPGFQTCGCGPLPDKGYEIVDETNLKAGALVETGTLDADFGADVPGSYAFKSNGFSSSGSKAGGNLTHNGVPVVVTLANGVWTGKAGNITIFTLELTGSNGDYTYTQFDNFDHADGNDPNDIITLDFVVEARDFEGDAVEGKIRIDVKDDAPVANNDVNTFDLSLGSATGNVVTGVNGGPGAADDVSTDAPNKVVKIAFGATEVDVPATGTVSIDGDNGTLTIAADGSYTYTPFANGGGSGGGSSGDFKNFSDGPALPDFNEAQAIDATEQQSLGIASNNLATTEGAVVSVKFVSEQALLNNTLGGFTIDSTGKVRFESILIQNTGTVSAGDSSSFTTSAGTQSWGLFVISDGVRQNNNFNNIDLNTGSFEFVVGYGTPGERAATINDSTATIDLVYTASNGTKTVLGGDIVFTSARGDSNTLNNSDRVNVASDIVGNDDTTLRVAFEDRTNLGDRDYNDLVIDVRIDEKDCNCGCPDKDIKDVFTYTLEDRDGDRDTATLTLHGEDLTDDVPQIVTPAGETVDETNLASGVITETGTISVNFGSDAPGTVDGNGTFTSSGSRLNNALTHNGVPVVVSFANGIYTGVANGTTVFTMSIAANGSYEFKLFEHLDHANGSDPNDIINLNFGVVATDCDGDKSQTTVTVQVKDDAPNANDDGRTTAENTTITGNVITNDVVGQDAPGTITQVVFNGTTFNLTSSNTVINATYGTLTINNTGAYSYTAKVNVDGVDNFVYTLRDRDGDTDTATLSIDVNDNDTTPQIIKPADEVVDETNLASGTITETGTITANFFADGPGTFNLTGSMTPGGSLKDGALTSNGVPITFALVGLNTFVGQANGVNIFRLTVANDGQYTFELYQQLDHADGTNPNDAITLDFGVRATDADGDVATTTLTVRVLDDAPVANNDGQFNVNENASVNGNVTANDTVGQDTPGVVTQVVFNGATTALPANGSNVTINGTYGTLVINNTGAYTYTAKNNVDGVDTFTYTLRDYDHDTDTATLSFKVNGQDDVPQIIKPAVETVDETNLASGVITETGTVTANFFADGPGTFAANGSFTSSGSRLNNALTHNGNPVTVVLNGDTYEGVAARGTGNERVVFTMKVNANGSYEFKLFEQLDHANGSDPNDIITLDFGVIATDVDGDNSLPTTITVNVRDDAPIANDDGPFNANEGATITGNVVSNDNVGQDNYEGMPFAGVTQVVFNGVVTNVPANGTNVTINGVYGTLTINATGAYSYTAKTNVDGRDNFTYTLRDRDGDTDTAVLCIDVKNNDDQPQIIKPATEVVDETNLASGVITETGSVTANFFGDGPGTFSANGSFTSSGSRLNNALTHNGIPVAVTLSGNTYTGSANGVTVFTLQINSNGSYEFKLFEQLDHANGSDPNDIITLDFGVKAVDADGDEAATTITVNVRDDAPMANDETRQTADGGAVTGNVITNDVVGQDTPGTITQVVFNGTTYNLTSSNTVINATYGTLTINNTGVYTYVAKTNVDGQDNFTYTLRDRDGDTDTAVLCIEVKDGDDQPQIIKPATEVVDETNLASGVITETGTVTANFFGDGPGSFSANGSFTSSGSRLNNALTHMGNPVSVTLSGNTYTGTANGVTIFTMTINTNGSYEFKLFEQLDHANGSDPNDIITLDFGVKAVDSDGDEASTTITVNVKDDAPFARPDFCTVFSSERQFSSNLLSNDTSGQDTALRVAAITFGGITTAIAASGTTVINTTYGTLTISANGSYTYVLKGTHTTNFTEELVVTVADRDGDTATSQFQINIIGDGTKGTAGNDTMYGDDNANVFDGLDGHDWLYGKGGNDTIRGSGGWDTIDGGTGNDTIYGGEGNDLLIGREGDDVVYGGEGNDDIYGDGGVSDTYVGNDTLYGEGGDDYIYGGAGTDYIDGGTGNDILYGGSGNDTIYGRDGNDDIIGETGNDVLFGGAGADKFWFLNINEGTDTIKDFSIAQGDKLELSNVITNYDPVTDAITDFVFATQSGGNTIISVNNAGTGSAGATTLAVLEGVSVSVSDLFNNGAIVH